MDCTTLVKYLVPKHLFFLSVSREQVALWSLTSLPGIHAWEFLPKNIYEGQAWQPDDWSSWNHQFSLPLSMAPKSELPHRPLLLPSPGTVAQLP